MRHEAVLRGFAGDGVCGPVTRNGLGPRFPSLVDILGHGYYGEGALDRCRYGGFPGPLSSEYDSPELRFSPCLPSISPSRHLPSPRAAHHHHVHPVSFPLSSCTTWWALLLVHPYTLSLPVPWHQYSPHLSWPLSLVSLISCPKNFSVVTPIPFLKC